MDYDLSGAYPTAMSMIGKPRWSEMRERQEPDYWKYVDQNRAGDHICYYSDLRKMRTHYPQWDITQSLESTIGQIVNAWKARRQTA